MNFLARIVNVFQSDSDPELNEGYSYPKEYTDSVFDGAIDQIIDMRPSISIIESKKKKPDPDYV